MNGMQRKQHTKGQALLEYILLVLMLSITMAVTIRKTNRTIYFFWTGLARSVASPCAGCTAPPPPDLPDRFDAAKDLSNAEITGK